MKTVHKTVLDLMSLDAESKIVLRLPQGSKLQFVGRQSNSEAEVTIWYEHDQYDVREPITEPRTVYVFGTGHAIPDRLRYVGSVIGQQFVWHVYEEYVG